MKSSEIQPRSIKKKVRDKIRKKITRKKALTFKFRASDSSKEEKERLLFEVFDILLYENKEEDH